MGKLLIANGAEIFRIGGGVGKAKSPGKIEVSVSVKHKYLGRIVSSEAGEVEQYYTRETEMGFSGLRCMCGHHLYT